MTCTMQMQVHSYIHTCSNYARDHHFQQRNRAFFFCGEGREGEGEPWALSFRLRFVEKKENPCLGMYVCTIVWYGVFPSFFLRRFPFPLPKKWFQLRLLQRKRTGKWYHRYSPIIELFSALSSFLLPLSLSAARRSLCLKKSQAERKLGSWPKPSWNLCYAIGQNCCLSPY